MAIASPETLEEALKANDWENLIIHAGSPLIDNGLFVVKDANVQFCTIDLSDIIKREYEILIDDYSSLEDELRLSTQMEF